MFDPKTLGEYALSHLDASNNEDVQRSLNLFQVFKRLYDQNPALLNDILSLATAEGQLSLRNGSFFYLIGLITDKQAFLSTNLVSGRSQTFLHPQQQDVIWTIGRDPTQASLVVRDRRLSRCHAAISYDTLQGFTLHDLNSTNGSYVNGVRIRNGYALQDGDSVRLGSLNFGFFVSSEFRRVAPPPPELQRLIAEASVPPTAPLESELVEDEVFETEESVPSNLEKTLYFLRRPPVDQNSAEDAGD
jgi:pSer/pThr/pTyr-binding forkhead associated (FHA) protein